MSEWFEEIVGHGRVTALLERELDYPANAYLFVGAASVGKATVARAFAAALLCPSGDPGCNICRRARGGNHADLVPVVPDGRATLGVDQIRGIVAQASLSPVEGSRKVFLVEEAGVMTDQAANALLKTLEEPTPTTVFILVAESEDEFPATVASRCRTVHFGRVPEPDMVPALAAAGVEADDAEGLARVAGGRPGLALALARQPHVADFRQLWLSIPGRVTPRPGDAQRLAEEVLTALAPMIKEAVGNEEDEERRKRAERRAELALLMSGLEILASWYTDSASLQHAGPIRNTDVALADLTDVTPARAVANAELVLDAMVDLQLNLRRQLLLADLFATLGAD
ncbi:MAG: ATP-binding protein [Acidimicrobiia bacterium]